MASFIKTIDQGLRSILFTKFGTLMGLESEAQGVFLYPKAVAMRKAAERTTKDAVEFISCWRVNTKHDWARQRTVVARRGMTLVLQDSDADSYGDGDSTSVVTVKAVPVEMEYEVSFWTKDLDMVNQTDELYLFWHQAFPRLSLYYEDLYPLELYLQFGDIMDESTIEDMFTQGLYFVHTAPIKVNGWIFTTSSIPTIKTVIITFYDEDDIESITTFVQDPDSSLELFSKEYDLTE